MTSEQKLCAFCAAVWVGTFADCVFRGVDSVFGRIFIWLASF